MKALVFVLVLTSFQIHAGEKADSRGNTYDFKNISTNNGNRGYSTEGLLTADQDRSLWGNPFEPIPAIQNLERQFGKRTRNSKDHCGQEYKHLQELQANVNAKQIPKPISVLREAVARFGISAKMLDKTIAVYLRNQTLIPNQRFVTIFDHTQPSTAKRFVILDLWRGEAKGYRSAHGKGSDPKHTGRTQILSNRDKSLQSSEGCAMVDGVYRAKVTRQEPQGRFAMNIMGFSAGKNDNSCDRSVYMHAAPYVEYERNVAGSRAEFDRKPGRSWGCPAFAYGERDEIFKLLNGGSMMCSWGSDK